MGRSVPADTCGVCWVPGSATTLCGGDVAVVTALTPDQTRILHGLSMDRQLERRPAQRRCRAARARAAAPLQRLHHPRHSQRLGS